MNLSMAKEGIEYIIDSVDINDYELITFLFSLGCYTGEPVTVVSKKKNSCTVAIKDARYNIDMQLAAAILLVR